MATTKLFPNSTNLSHTNPTKNLLFQAPSLPFTSPNHFFLPKRDFSVLSYASSSIIPVIDVDYVEREFSSDGVSYTKVGDGCVVKMAMDNGSVATIMLPSGLITSYKPKMWHGATVELLQTLVSEGDDEEDGVVIQGGVSVNLTLGSSDGFSWSPTTWILQDVRGSSQNSIQVELSSSDSENKVQVKRVVTLHPDVLISEIVISNARSSAIELTGSLMSHLTVSSPEATYAIGLQGSDYLTIPPRFTDFSIIPPQESQWSQENDQIEIGEMEEEKDGEVSLTNQMSRIYTSAPGMFDVLDRGRRNSVGVGSEGFEEIYLFSPGSIHEMYGDYAFICIGPSAMLKPIILDSRGMWKGVQYLQNPNL